MVLLPRRASRPAIELMERRELLTSGPSVWIVDSTGDSGLGKGDKGDILYCILKANADDNPAGDTINFSPTLFKHAKTITVVDGELELTNPLGIQTIGAGKSHVTIEGSDEDQTGSVITVAEGVNAQLYNLRITGGNTQNLGGGIDNEGMLAVVGCTISGNTVDAVNTLGGGGGIWNGFQGILTVYQSTIVGNVATTSGPSNTNIGGGISNAGIASVFDSTIANNSSYNGGGLFNSAKLALINDTITGNTTVSGGGGGLYNLDSGGVTAINCTIVNNNGSGITTYGDGSDLILENSIVAENPETSGVSGMDDDLDLAAASIDKVNSGYNLIGYGGAGGEYGGVLANGVNGNIVGVTDPLLGALANNGGPTETIALLAGSPALGAGNVDYVNNLLFFGPPPTDQRGVGYDRIVNGLVDIGAYETQAAS